MAARRLASLALLALLAAGPVAARADDPASLRAKVQNAMHAAKSFVVTTTASTGFNVTMTFAAPDRYHSTLAYNGQNRDVVLVGPNAKSRRSKRSTRCTSPSTSRKTPPVSLPT